MFSLILQEGNNQYRLMVVQKNNETGKSVNYLHAILEKDNQVIQSIYDDFLPKVRQFVCNNNGSADEAKDVFDKVIFQLYTRMLREPFTIKSSFEAYLFTACKNLWRRQLNKNKKRRVTNEQVTELYYEEKELTQATLEQERWELFKAKLEQLSDNCRKVLRLYFNKVSAQQIMEHLDYASEVTVRQRIFKCKQKLIQMVQDDQRYTELKTI